MSAPAIEAPALTVVPEQQPDGADHAQHLLVQSYAERFGQFIKHGGTWEYARLAATCCTAPGPGRMRKADKDRGKVPVSTFAEWAGIDKDTVSAYLRAWEHAADQGAVPSCGELDVSYEYVLPENLPEWSSMYRAANRKVPEGKTKVAPVSRSVARAVKSLTEMDREVVASMSQDERDAFATDVLSLSEWVQDMIDVIDSTNGG